MDLQRLRHLAGMEPLAEGHELLVQEEEMLTEARKVSGAQKTAGGGAKYNFNGTDYGSASEAKEAKNARVASLTKEIAGLKDDSPMKAPLSRELARIKKADVGSGKADDTKRKEVNKTVYKAKKAGISPEDQKKEDDQKEVADMERKAEKSSEREAEARYRRGMGETD